MSAKILGFYLGNKRASLEVFTMEERGHLKHDKTSGERFTVHDILNCQRYDSIRQYLAERLNIVKSITKAEYGFVVLSGKIKDGVLLGGNPHLQVEDGTISEEWLAEVAGMPMALFNKWSTTAQGILPGSRHNHFHALTHGAEFGNPQDDMALIGIGTRFGEGGLIYEQASQTHIPEKYKPGNEAWKPVDDLDIFFENWLTENVYPEEIISIKRVLQSSMLGHFHRFLCEEKFKVPQPLWGLFPFEQNENVLKAVKKGANRAETVFRYWHQSECCRYVIDWYAKQLGHEVYRMCSTIKSPPKGGVVITGSLAPIFNVEGVRGAFNLGLRQNEKNRPSGKTTKGLVAPITPNPACLYDTDSTTTAMLGAGALAGKRFCQD